MFVAANSNKLVGIALISHASSPAPPSQVLDTPSPDHVGIILASSPGLRGGGERRPGIDCMRMRQRPSDFEGFAYARILSDICTVNYSYSNLICPLYADRRYTSQRLQSSPAYKTSLAKEE